MKKNYNVTLDYEVVQMAREDGLCLSSTLNELLRKKLESGAKERREELQEVKKELMKKHGNKNKKQLKIMMSVLEVAKPSKLVKLRMQALREMIEDAK